MVVGDFPIETDTIVIGAALVDTLQQFVQLNTEQKVTIVRKVILVVFA